MGMEEVVILTKGRCCDRSEGPCGKPAALTVVAQIVLTAKSLASAAACARTPHQSAVFYDSDEVVGSDWIVSLYGCTAQANPSGPSPAWMWPTT
jgi:hypothetical protein